MKEVAVSEFKAKCLGLIEEVRKTRKPIRLTRFGEPVAELVPASPQTPPKRWLGSYGWNRGDPRGYRWSYRQSR